MGAMLKRTFLFILVNALVLLSLSIVFNILVAALGGRNGIDPSFWIFYAFLGFGGAFISLALSRVTAKWTLGVKLIDPETRHPLERQLLETVYALARTAQLPRLPEVGVYESPEVNAFATGPTKARSLVAVSTGLLDHMDNAAVTGVLGHEVTHIANGDMVTMTLLQGLINTMVLIVARLLSSIIANSTSNENSRGGMRLVIYYVLQTVLSLLGSVVVCYVSRRREYRADLGGARLAGKERMLSGLRALRAVYGTVDENQQALATLKISGHSTNTLAALFATHPPLEERIRRLESLA